MSAPVARYSRIALPRYRYRPGRDPHPVRDPRGHSYGAASLPAGFAPERWAACDAYLHAIDLWNAGYFWEVHEALEDLWHECADDPAAAGLLKGMIQSAAALLKQTLGESRGAARLAARGTAALRDAPARLLGFDADALAARIESFVAGTDTEAPKITLDGVGFVAVRADEADAVRDEADH